MMVEEVNMTVIKGDPVFVSLKGHTKPIFGFVVAKGGTIADVLLLHEGGHIHLEKDLKERVDGEDHGFLTMDAPEPKSAKQVAKETAVADAQKKLLEGSLTKSDGEGDGSGLVPSPAPTSAESETDGEGEQTEESSEVDPEDGDESEDDEETSSDGEESEPKPAVAKASARSAPRRKR
jgi:hypothetical protein